MISMKKTALITGATSGIGSALARKLSSDYRLILCGRRAHRLAQIKDELSDCTDIHTLCFDVGKKQEVLEAIDGLPQDWKSVDVLVNNAGNAHGRAPLHMGDMDDWDAMIDSNLRGMLYITRAIAPQMVSKKTGDIVNISSIAGKEAYENGNVYCATKYGVDGLTKSLRHELLPYGIRVMCINPGMVQTEFSLVRFKGDEQAANEVYAGTMPLTAEDVADTIAFAISRPRHVNLADITIFATCQASATAVYREEKL